MYKQFNPETLTKPEPLNSMASANHGSARRFNIPSHLPLEFPPNIPAQRRSRGACGSALAQKSARFSFPSMCRMVI
jgi:hypothetical protein